MRNAADYRNREALIALQSQKLHELAETLAGNEFYRRKLAGHDLQNLRTPADLARLPFTTKDELAADQQAHPPYGTVHDLRRYRYTRLHQTSGTSGQPLRWLDTPESWSCMLDTWAVLFDLAGLTPTDRLFFPFSFGPFLGFWTAFEAATRQGFFCLPGGGLSSVARMRMIQDNGISVVFCTPTYALRLAEVAQLQSLDLTRSPVRALILAGEPGGSIATTRQRIETAWGARVFDHCGMTEVGPVGIECQQGPGGLHILESAFVAEVVEPQPPQEPTPPGETGELVLTTLGRLASPLLRYRTGDLVRTACQPCPCGRAFVRLEGGILGRTDDMIHLRGNNLYPSALEAILRGFPEVAEYRLNVLASELRIEVESAAPGPDLADRITGAIRDKLLFRAEVVTVPPGSLPRFEMKAQRVQRG
jgi:phenylacetate-CoA ligase